MKIFVLLLLILIVSCGDSSIKQVEKEVKQKRPNKITPNKVKKRNSEKHGVLIMDNGFDTQNEVFQNKVVGLYTFECKERDSDFGVFLENIDHLSFAEVKDLLIKRQQESFNDCSMKEGIKFSKSDELKKIQQYKNEVNHFYRQKGQVGSFDIEKETAKEIDFILNGEDDKFSYHGINVSSLIAYKNTNVELVFVQRKFQDSTKLSRLNGKNEKVKGKNCLIFNKFDQFIEILESRDYQNAFIEKKATGKERELSRIIKKHNINFLNYSFNSNPREEFEKILKTELSCTNIPNLKKWYRIENSLEKKRLEYLETNDRENFYQNDVLTIQAAGNEGVTLDTIEDGRECSDVKNNHLLVGSVDYRGIDSDFSNKGNCVALKLIGESLLAFTAGDFLYPVYGTSFSTPLVIRYLTKKFNANSSIVEMKNSLLSSANFNKVLGNDFFPTELAWENVNQKVPTSVVAKISNPREKLIKLFYKIH